MNFGEAIEIAKQGGRIARSGWNGTGMFAFIKHPKNLMVIDGVEYTKRPAWYLKTAQDDVATWTPSGSDTLAEDWLVVENAAT